MGGKRKNVGRGYRKNKTLVAGALQRGGKVRLERIPDVSKKTLHSFVARNVKDEAEAIYTDEWKGYLGLEDDDTRHETVTHSEEEWVVGDVHTNGIEGVWSLFKRSIVGPPPDQQEALGPLHRGDGVALQQPQQPAHVPGHADPHPAHRAAAGTGSWWAGKHLNSPRAAATASRNRQLMPQGAYVSVKVRQFVDGRNLQLLTDDPPRGPLAMLRPLARAFRNTPFARIKQQASSRLRSAFFSMVAPKPRSALPWT